MKELLDKFRAAKDELAQFKRTHFPVGSFVKVKGANSTSHCIVSMGDGCPPDKLPVMYGNGNIWWKPLQDCERITNTREAHPQIRRMAMNRKLATAQFKIKERSK